MRRKTRRIHEGENPERWMVSYADFITLLFAFFVVMYAISSVNEGKYRVLSESLSNAFSVTARTLEPIQVGEIKRSGDPQSVEFIKRPVVIDRSDTPAPVPKKRMGDIQEAGDKPLQILFEELRASVAEISDKGLVKVNTNEYGVEIEISSSILFDSGEAVLSEQAKPAIQKLAQVLMPFPHEVNVQGYTDNIPIQSSVFPSNWQLSAARAASVVQLFAQLGMSPDRLSATGFGEYRAAADNKTENGRQQNRRVVIFVPVLKDKERVMEAIRLLGDRMNRGITYDQPARPEGNEGIREDIKEPVPEIIQSPSSESRFYNSAPPVSAGQPSETRTPASTQAARIISPVAQEELNAETGERHIGRQPIEGFRLPSTSSEVIQ